MGQGKILIYDKEIFYSTLIEDILHAEKYQVIKASKPGELTKFIEKYEPHVVICDVSELGDGDLILLGTIKKTYPTLPIISIVSSERKELVVRYIRAGVFDCIEKPIIKEELILSVKKAIEFTLYKNEEIERLSKIHKIAKGTETLLKASRKSLPEIPLNYPGSMLIQSILDSIVIAFDAEKVSLSWLDREKKKYYVVACAGYCMDIKLFKPRSIGEGIVGYVANTKEPIYVPDISKDERFNSSPFKDQYKSSSFMCGPVVLNNEVVAVVSVSDRKIPKPYNEEDFILFKSFIAQISFALESSYMISFLEASLRRVNIYKEISSLIVDIVDTGDILNKILSSVSKYLNAEGCALYVIDENKENFLLEAKSGLNFKEKFVFHELLGKLLSSSQDHRSSRALFNAITKFIDNFNIKNFLSFPIYMKNFPLGFLLFINLSSIEDVDFDTMQDICKLISVAFKNNWLYKNLCITADELVRVNKELEEANKSLIDRISKID
ncbi:MAG: GAF domain-containing protein [Proteobacteria bacterium]|nr:GAF domain-containing protein [Pseudomonadota bacterium]